MLGLDRSSQAFYISYSDSNTFAFLRSRFRIFTELSYDLRREENSFTVEPASVDELSHLARVSFISRLNELSHEFFFKS